MRRFLPGWALPWLPRWLPRWLPACLLALALVLPALPAAAASLTVFAAASLTDALRQAGAAWAAQGHPAPVFSFAASSMLARQLQQGAPAGLFISADEEWMDWAAKRGLIAEGTRRDLLSNTLVLVEPKASARPVKIGPGFDLAAILGPHGRLAVGDPAHVPAGIYARQALTKLGLWAMAEPRLARADNVRSALLLVERGETPAGIVYTTDAAASSAVAVAGTFPADTHPPILYPAAVVRSGDTPEARAFLAFLATPEAARIFAAHGFIVGKQEQEAAVPPVSLPR
jgi:molybdate transport system substrate-binding protein